MAGKDKVEYDILANDKASRPMDKIANKGKDIGDALDKGAKKGSDALEKLKKSGKDAGESLAKIGDKGKEGLGKLTEGLKAGPLAMIGLGAGLGALVMEGFSEALENEDATALLTAQIGASDAEMAKLGKISGDLYKDAFGESVAEVNDVMKTVFQSGLASVSDAEDKIKGVTTQVMNYSKITGEEALPVTRAISQMLKTGLAPNATAAFDLLTRGVQKGLDKSEDLLDTVNEYSTQFRSLGLNGPQALGLISQALQAGARDSDIAADALKEFSIRAVDGSTLTAESFEALGLSAKGMQAQIAKGGEPAAKGLDLVLDRLRGVKDPAKQAAIAVGLFGTQSEDMKAALMSMDLSTAVSEFGQVAGAAERAGDVLGGTTSSKLTTLGRTIKTELVDAIGKYALPKLSEFADWFNGPGAMVIVGWALDGADAMIKFGDWTLGALQKVIPTLAKVGAVAMVSAAGVVALSNPKQALALLNQAKAMDEWGQAAGENISKARTELQSWSTTLGKTKTKVELQAEIEGLEQNIAKAQAQLRDPGLTKTRKAELTANIAQLTRQKDAAIRKLNDPGLIKTRVAQLTANKQNLDTRIAAAKRQLADPKLTATKTAQLKANIAQLLRQKASAQASINNLTGKTVVISAAVRINSANVRAAVERQLARLGLEGREHGGKVRKGQAYVVGEKRPELFVAEQDGEILPSVPATVGAQGAPSYAGSGGGYGGMVTLNFEDSEVGRFMLRMMRKAIADSGNGRNVQLALGGALV